MNFLQHKNILIISPEGWGKSKLSKHHYAIKLAAMGNRIWYLLPEFAQQFPSQEKIPTGITLMQDRYSIRGMRHFPTIIQNIFFNRMRKRIEKDAGVHFDIVWSFDNSRFFDLDCFEDALKILHCMDFHYTYQMELAATTADICLGVTTGIVSNLKKNNPNSFFIQHGYASFSKNDYQLPAVNEKWRAVYVGNLARPHIRWDWLYQAASSLTEIHFQFIGSTGISHLGTRKDENIEREIQRLSKLKNVSFLGELSADDADNCLQQADILFAAFDSENHPEVFSNLHKMLSYLGSGKPIVSNYMSEYANISDLIYMAKDTDSFVGYFRKITTIGDDELNESKAQKRKTYANNNTYERQIERIDQLITKLKR